jgi:hypothetical protein
MDIPNAPSSYSGRGLKTYGIKKRVSANVLTTVAKLIKD